MMNMKCVSCYSIDFQGIAGLWIPWLWICDPEAGACGVSSAAAVVGARRGTWWRVVAAETGAHRAVSKMTKLPSAVWACALEMSWCCRSQLSSWPITKQSVSFWRVAVGKSFSPVQLPLTEPLPLACPSAVPFYRRCHLGLVAKCRARRRRESALHLEPERAEVAIIDGC